MYRDEDLRRVVACLHCMECGVIGESQAGHSNLAVHGKGGAQKASDAAIFSLCHSSCHEALDQGDEMNAAEKEAATYRYIASTYIALIELGFLEISPAGRAAALKQPDWQG